MTKQHLNGTTRPFLKWAGNKYRILHEIQPLLPSGRRLIEPFAGSAALFLNTQFDKYLIADSNGDLISLYNILKKHGDAFIEQARRLFAPRFNNAETYYRRRDEFNRSNDPLRKAALFIYLNRHGYNGLCRYNASGGFNVPFGRYTRPYFPEAEMRAFRRKARRAVFKHRDFKWAFEQAQPGDVIYCDPPYVPLSRSASFTAYSAGGFGLTHQALLAQLAKQSAARGVPVLISNHNTAETRRYYREASQHHYFQVRRNISCNGDKREDAGEVLVLFDAPSHTGHHSS